MKNFISENRELYTVQIINIVSIQQYKKLKRLMYDNHDLSMGL